VVRVSCKKDADWLERVLAAFDVAGCAIVEDVVEEAMLEQTRAAMYGVQATIRREIGQEKLAAAGELGVLRLMLKYDSFFFQYLELPEVLQFVDATVSPTAILHVQNGLILPSFEGGAPEVFQNRFHRDFPRILNGYLMSVNTFFAIDHFTTENGGTFLLPGSHQKERPPDFFLIEEAVTAECAAGSMIVFDSTLWHASGDNRSGQDRLAINQQFTRSYIKQQVDYVRALGDDAVQARSPRTQQLVGWYTRVVTSLDEYYRPPDERLYRSGQG
jgi:ectoine hydroxylase-related dioxygenase (phytanoyl-CoA dioxygenase family)